MNLEQAKIHKLTRYKSSPMSTLGCYAAQNKCIVYFKIGALHISKPVGERICTRSVRDGKPCPIGARYVAWSVDCE